VNDDTRPLTEADLLRIERGLSDCERRDAGFCRHVVEFHGVTRLVANVRRLRALLATLQWTHSVSLCPVCGVEKGQPHAADCELAAHLTPPAAPSPARRRTFDEI
jgi:hypothetical protein